MFADNLFGDEVALQAIIDELLLERNASESEISWINGLKLTNPWDAGILVDAYRAAGSP